ncbi:MAG TPA: RDD family protein [Paenibacillaceae bacterium]|nr:RDD family protein [Paenibacillaceae bacterium]
MQLQRQERPAGFWIRLGAAILDGIIVGIPLAILLTLLGGGGSVEEMIQSNGVVDPAQLQQYLTANGIISLISLLYGLLLPTLWNGYTLGKRIVGIHIVKANGDKVSFGTMLMRNIVGGIVELIALWGLVSLIMIIARKDKRTLHDLVAGTQVTYVIK